MGFFEADGCFSINNRGEIRFDLYQHTFDVALLFKIKTYLQCGNVYTPKGKTTSTFTIYGVKHFKFILYPIFNNRILSDYKFNQFKKVCESINLTCTKGKHKSRAWLNGFIDGDGSFFVSVSEAQVMAVLNLGQKQPEVLSIIALVFFNNTVRVNGHNYSILRFNCTSISYINKFIVLPFLTRKNISFKR